jgi:hypothetical protein
VAPWRLPGDARLQHSSDPRRPTGPGADQVLGDIQRGHEQPPPAAIAQLGERQTEDLKVPGSIPGLGTLAELLFVCIWCQLATARQRPPPLAGPLTPIDDGAHQ